MKQDGRICGKFSGEDLEIEPCLLGGVVAVHEQQTDIVQFTVRWRANEILRRVKEMPHVLEAERGEIPPRRVGIPPKVVHERRVDEYDVARFDVVFQRAGDHQRDEAAIGADHHGQPAALHACEAVVQPAQSEIEVCRTLLVAHLQQFRMSEQVGDPGFERLHGQVFNRAAMTSGTGGINWATVRSDSGDPIARIVSSASGAGIPARLR